MTGGGYTIPSAQLYPHQWAWDSAFSAIGWSIWIWIGPWEARGSEHLGGRESPHILFHVPSDAYFPAGSGESTAAPSPSLLCGRSRSSRSPAWWRRARIRSPAALEASHFFFSNARDPLRMGAVSVSHPGRAVETTAPPGMTSRERRPRAAPPFTERT